MKILVIMPTYCEIENLESSAGDLLLHNPQVSLLIVDDASPDGTGELADTLSKKDERISVLHRDQKAGLGPAYLAGFEWGMSNGFDFLVEMDADGSHRGEDLVEMLKIADEADLVIGSRWVRGGAVVNWPWYRKLISVVGNRYAGFWLGSSVKDLTAGFRVYKVTFLQQLDLTQVSSQGYSFQVEMAYRTLRSGGVVRESPITFMERTSGKSKMTLAIVFEALTRVTSWGLRRMINQKSALPPARRARM